LIDKTIVLDQCLKPEGKQPTQPLLCSCLL